MRRNRLTERDLSRIVRRVIKEGDESEICKKANEKFTENQLNDYLEIIQEVVEMVKELDRLETYLDCDAAKVLSFNIMFKKIVDKWDNVPDSF